VKADSGRISQIARAWPADVRLVLLCGPDEGATSDLASALTKKFGDNVERLAGKAVAEDPQALIAAAMSLSMFGDATLVVVEGLDEPGLPAVEALLAGPAGNPVLALSGALKKTNKLKILADESPAIACLESYEPNLANARRLIDELAGPMGLTVEREAATSLFEATEGNRLLLRRELEKLALYRDASPQRPARIDASDVAAVGFGAGDADQQALVDAISSGATARAVELLGRFPANMAIPLLRALERRLGLLLSLREAVDNGTSPKAAVEGARPPIFWKERDAIAAMLPLWTRTGLADAMTRLLAAERAVKTPGSLADQGAAHSLIEIARKAAAGRR